MSAEDSPTKWTVLSDIIFLETCVLDALSCRWRLTSDGGADGGNLHITNHELVLGGCILVHIHPLHCVSAGLPLALLN